MMVKAPWTERVGMKEVEVKVGAGDGNRAGAGEVRERTREEKGRRGGASACSVWQLGFHHGHFILGGEKWMVQIDAGFNVRSDGPAAK
jgi:hypothetical protein